MSKQRHLVALIFSVGVALGSWGQAMPGATEIGQAGRGGGSFEFWANQRSNALQSSFIQTMNAGGFISRDFLGDFLSSHPLMGGMGVQVGWSKRWSTKPLGGQWALTGELGSELLCSAMWRRELLELVYLGNAGHLGRVDQFSGSGIRLGAFNRISAGIENTGTRQRLELSVVQRIVGFEMGIPNGSFWVSSSADSMEVNMQSYAQASLDDLPDSSGFTFRDLIPAYGIGLSGSLPLTSELWPLQFQVDFKDVGIMWEPAGGVIGAIDTGFATTGLSVPLAAYFNEEYESEQITLEDLVNGETGLAVDSILLVSDSALGRMLMLPTQIKAQLTWWPVPDVQVRAMARAGSWMPEPEFTLGVGWIPTKRWAFGLDFRSGGWGGPRPVTWMDFRVSKKRILSLEVDDPAGWFWNSEASGNSYGRGIRLSLRRLPGNQWTRYMGLPQMEIGRKQP